jgi:hypothetical protein
MISMEKDFIIIPSVYKNKECMELREVDDINKLNNHEVKSQIGYISKLTLDDYAISNRHLILPFRTLGSINDEMDCAKIVAQSYLDEISRSSYFKKSGIEKDQDVLSTIIDKQPIETHIYIANIKGKINGDNEQYSRSIAYLLSMDQDNITLKDNQFWLNGISIEVHDDFFKHYNSVLDEKNLSLREAGSATLPGKFLNYFNLSAKRENMIGEKWFINQDNYHIKREQKEPQGIMSDFL